MYLPYCNVLLYETQLPCIASTNVTDTRQVVSMTSMHEHALQSSVVCVGSS